MEQRGIDCQTGEVEREGVFIRNETLSQVDNIPFQF